MEPYCFQGYWCIAAKWRDIVYLNAKNRSEKGFKMHKSLQIWGWFLPKKIDLPTQGGGGRNGNFRGSKNQKSGKCHELSRKSIKFVFYPSHPGGGVRGGGGSKFQKSGKFHELSRKSIIFFLPIPPRGGSGGGGGGLGIKISKVR